VNNNAAGGGWGFTDDGNRGNLTGGDGGFAMVDSDHLGVGRTQDTELRTPVVDLTAQTAPVIGINSDYRSFGASVADVDLSVDGAKVRSTDDASVTATSAPTPEDTNLGDGFYWLFSPLTGPHQFTASHGGYTDQTKTVDVATDFATRADFSLAAGHIVVKPG